MFIFYFSNGDTRIGYGDNHDAAWKSTGLAGKHYAGVLFHTTSDTRADYRFDKVSRSWQPSEAYLKTIPTV